LASAECFNEFGAAWYMGKRVIPLFLLPPSFALDVEAKTRLTRVLGEDQGVDLAPCLGVKGALKIDSDANLADRLKAGRRSQRVRSGFGFRLDQAALTVAKFTQRTGKTPQN
jgi:hypothetical protein